MRFLIAGFVVLVAACGDGASPTTTVLPATTSSAASAAVPACSAQGMPAQPEPQDLPEPVAATRTAIVAAAAACDFDGLAAIVTAGVPGLFTYSLGDRGDPAGFWRAQEAAGIRSLEALVATLGLPFGRMSVVGDGDFVWPSAFAYDSWEDVPEADRRVLDTLYADDDLVGFADFGAFAGYRTAIAQDGSWVFFVTGD